MSAPGFVQAIEASVFGEWLRSYELAMPVVNAIHVLCIATVYGSIMIVDLRLLGLLDRAHSIRQMSRETLRLTWMAFVGAAITGALFFSANASTYWFNTAFRFKMLAILLGGINMLVFQFGVYRGVAGWDRNAPAPGSARFSAALSLLIWTAVVVLGRIIGFTKGVEVVVPDNLNFDFSAP